MAEKVLAARQTPFKKSGLADMVIAWAGKGKILTQPHKDHSQYNALFHLEVCVQLDKYEGGKIGCVNFSTLILIKTPQEALDALSGWTSARALRAMIMVPMRSTSRAAPASAPNTGTSGNAM